MSKTESGRRSALLVATGTYSDKSLARLRAPAGDVAALADVLSDPKVGDFEVTEPLVDRSSNEIEQEIEQFFNDRRPDDMLLLYLSCHGVLSGRRRLYFAATNTQRTLLKTTAVDASLIADVMHDTRARRVVLILDCCHSGEFSASAAKGGRDVGIGTRFEQGIGRATLTASDELEAAFESDEPTELGDRPLSVFTDVLVTGLKTGEADRNRDGHVSLDELYDYLCEEVPKRDRNQTPGLSGDFRGDIFIARSAAAPQPAELATELKGAISSRFAGIREGAVRELEEMLRSADRSDVEAARLHLAGLAADDSQRVSRAAKAALESSITDAGAHSIDDQNRGDSPIPEHDSLTAVARISAEVVRRDASACVFQLNLTTEKHLLGYYAGAFKDKIEIDGTKSQPANPKGEYRLLLRDGRTTRIGVLRVKRSVLGSIKNVALTVDGKELYRE